MEQRLATASKNCHSRGTVTGNENPPVENTRMALSGRLARRKRSYALTFQVIPLKIKSHPPLGYVQNVGESLYVIDDTDTNLCS